MEKKIKSPYTAAITGCAFLYHAHFAFVDG